MESCLNQLTHFNVLNGLPPDIMHDLLEGVIRYNISCLMEYYEEKKIYSAKQLNSDLQAFPYGRIDRINKIPTTIFSEK
jgi:hypothetical protein